MSSRTAATWTSLCVSTPPTTRRAIVFMPPLPCWVRGGTHRRAGGQDSDECLLHRRLFGHGRPTGACTERASLTRPTGHFKDTRRVSRSSGVRPGERGPLHSLPRRGTSTWILTADSEDRTS